MRESPVNLTLKRAAQVLGVHEQTLRSWEKRGLIRMIRLPGSRYRRVPVEEVDRLKREMAPQLSPPGLVLSPPRQDSESLARAESLAAAVRAELSDLEAATTLDELMTSRRGRAWLP
jgi:excisionase family DNA binding protein